MSADVLEIWELIIDYCDRILRYFLHWLDGIQSDEQLQNMLLVFMVGLTLGWFLRNIFTLGNTKKHPSSGSPGVSVRTSSGKSKEEVELDARRRL